MFYGSLGSTPNLLHQNQGQEGNLPYKSAFIRKKKSSLGLSVICKIWIPLKHG
jgi:hypothetical protein